MGGGGGGGILIISASSHDFSIRNQHQNSVTKLLIRSLQPMTSPRQKLAKHQNAAGQCKQSQAFSD